ncbi:hypothetical protein DPMN_159942 [Dreissena polymorpha]|uniref:Uncharacterized protein n=1 Tax=Dreissena polymorpha TaxID=45954 RepID=A0A9D4INB0_DREPO|nr:hypothetical protein DPMN_159942 [Dreissena polymorpha]
MKLKENIQFCLNHQSQIGDSECGDTDLSLALSEHNLIGEEESCIQSEMECDDAVFRGRQIHSPARIYE